MRHIPLYYYHAIIQHMESYERAFTDTLPLRVDHAYLGSDIDISGLLESIREEVLYHANAEEGTLLRNVFSRIENARLMIAMGDGDDLLYRGAVELLRILPSLLAPFFELDQVVRLDELSQVYMKGDFVLPDIDAYELSEEDVAFFEALGRFGHESDRYNEQVLSSDYYSFVSEQTLFGNITSQQMATWLMSAPLPSEI